jgi:hypothetical protein
VGLARCFPKGTVIGHHIIAYRVHPAVPEHDAVHLAHLIALASAIVGT